MSIHYVYGLRAAGTDEIRYVGVTNDPQVRLWAHLRGDNLSNPGLCEWALSHDIRMDILATTENEAERRALEEKWIRAQRAMGADLFNIRAGKQYVMTRQERVDFLSDWLDKHEKSPI